MFAREAGAVGGPPVAVKRLSPIFPAAFELTEADSMMGQPFPDPLPSRRASTPTAIPPPAHPPIPRSALDGVKAGRTDVRLVLRR